MTRHQAGRFGAYLLVVVMGAWGLWSIKAETRARERQACATAIETRAEQEELLVRMVTDLGGDGETVAVVRDAYDDLPDPASCG